MDWGGKILYEGETKPEKGSPVLATLDNQKMYPYMMIHYDESENKLMIFKGECYPTRNGSDPMGESPCNILDLPLEGELEKFLETVIHAQEIKEVVE
jgi:hypothetical protein